MVTAELDASVKEEPGEEEPCNPADPVDVSPGVVLDKLEALVTGGRVLLRYGSAEQVAGNLWGVNGKIDDVWRSFRVREEGVCEFVDDTVWVTDPAIDWAQSELEWLEQIRSDAEKVPCSSASQPTALYPRLCRKAAISYHSAVFEREHPEGVQDDEEPPADKGAIPKAPVAKAPVAKGPPVAKDQGPKAKAPVAKSPVAKAPVAKAPPLATQPADGNSAETFPMFLQAVKARFLENGLKKKYVQFLKAVRDGGNVQVIVSILSGHDDFTTRYRTLRCRKTAPSTASPTTGAVAAEAASAAAASPDAAASAKKDGDIKSEIMETLLARGGDVAAQLVNLVLANRCAPAHLRLDTLRYTRARAGEPSQIKQMTILRGPPGMDKSSWAVQQILEQAHPLESDEAAARVAHLCDVDDFFLQWPKSRHGHRLAKKYEVPGPEGMLRAMACNELRVKLAIEAGIDPLFVDGCHASLWEMAPYVKFAKQAGYEVAVVEPEEINSEWRTVEPLLENMAKRAKVTVEELPFSKEAMEAMVEAFEPLPSGEDTATVILKATRPASAVSSALKLLSVAGDAKVELGDDEQDDADQAETEAASGKKRAITTEVSGDAPAKKVAKASSAETTTATVDPIDAAAVEMEKQAEAVAAESKSKPSVSAIGTGAELSVTASLLSSFRKTKLGKVA
eukprot:TRINITY_DN75275_c0_g1_i1.p1 TRINITY_DN75275_c0_g1~~TRINITY_DN75275_c0_g1_i1.p1  ORF type:complete len:679 (+),score=148.93 TRINITY_DN75275_c0_g1_i1:79-2115(+)